jgi:aldehyde:ferredoxin oxidoreductase
MENTYGWKGIMLRVNLTSGEIQTLPTIELAERFIGGRGFVSKIYWDEVDTKTDALHPDNPLMVITGPLAGTPAVSGNRWFIAGKSPLLYPDQFGLGNVGGSMATKIKAAGFDGIIITGKAPRPIYVHINDGKLKIKDATGLWGCEIPDTLKRLRSEHGENAQAVCIGPAGENMVRLAIAMSDNGACGGSGFGAVMGSKNLKAIVVEGSGKVAIAKPDKLKETNSQIRSLIEGRILMDPNIEGIELIKRSPCPGCPSGCPRGIYKHVSGKEEIRKNCGSAYMYYLWDRMQHGGESTPNAFLATSLIDRFGLCAQEMNNLLHWLHECGKKGILTDDKAGITISQLGTLEFIEKLVDMIVHRKGFGDVLAEGTGRAARTVGKGAEEVYDLRATRSGFNALAYNPRFFITNAVFYATESTSTMNQLHEVCFPMMKWTMWFATDGSMSSFSTEVMQNIARKFWKSEKAVDFSTYKGKAEVAFIVQNREYAKENLVVCDFMYPISTADGAEDHVGDPTLESRLLSAVTGINFNEEAYYRTGERIFNLQRAIQGREGRVGRKDDRLNEFNFTEPFEEEPGFFAVFNPEYMLPGPGGELISRKGKVVERDKFEKVMDEYYTLRGWDIKTGLQRREQLEALELSDIIPDLKRKGLLIE